MTEVLDAAQIGLRQRTAFLEVGILRRRGRWGTLGGKTWTCTYGHWPNLDHACPCVRPNVQVYRTF